MKRNLRSIITGMILGDGCVSKVKTFSIVHSTKQEEYLLWKVNLLKNKFKFRIRRYSTYLKQTNKSYPQISATTLSYKYFKLIRQYMYGVDNIKKVRLKDLKKLKSLGLAIWYMDDGCFSFMKNKDKTIRGRQLILNTQSFTYKENEVIQKYFKDYYDITTRIHKDKDRFRIWMNGTESKKFIDIVRPHIPSCMNYKLCYRYEKKDLEYNLCKKPCDKNNCEFNIL